MKPERVLALGFAGLICLGTLLLALPAAAANGRSIGLADSLFTATSAVCVTGLVVRDTGTAFSPLGQAILLLLVQLGGVGFMVFGTVAATLFGRRISLAERLVIRESMNTVSVGGVVRLARRYGLLTLVTEGAGALLLSVRFVPQYGTFRGIWYSIFHAVSAFCNAGFDLFGGYRSLTGYRDDPLLLGVIAVLIIIGGLGFSVLEEVKSQKSRRLSLHARMVLRVSAFLLFNGTVIYALMEWNNPKTLACGDAPPGVRVINAFFQAATMRTAGFNTVDISAMSDVTKLVSVMLMFIGASPASTGGGIKTTTIAVAALMTGSVVRGKGRDAQWMGRRVSQGIINRAMAVICISAAAHVTGIAAVSIAEAGKITLIDAAMEVASALNTVGVSSAGTRNLCDTSRVILIPMMFLGRVGPLTLLCALHGKAGRNTLRIHLPVEDVIIG